MEILGIGPLEFLLIIVIMLLVLGPKEMVATAGKIGRFIRQVVRSPIWGTVMQTSKEVRDLPNRIIREAGLEQEIAQIKEVAKAPAAMMSEAAKQLKVEIPKIPNPFSPSSFSSTPSTTQVSPPPATSPTTTATPVPLEIEPIAPLTIESPAPNSFPYTQEAPTPLQVNFDETSPTPQPEVAQTPLAVEPVEPQTVQASEGPVAPLIVESFEPPVITQADLKTIPAPKRRTRRSKPDAVSSNQEQPSPASGESADQILPTPPYPIDSISETPQTVRKPKRSRVKPTPLETEPLVLVEPSSPHENGGSAKGG
jgi:Sec-independent protein translocase protein TatA